MTTVLVGIEEHAQALELIDGTKHGTRERPLLRNPQRHSVAEEVSFAMDLELPLDLRLYQYTEFLPYTTGATSSHLPVRRRQRQSRPQEPRLVLPIRSQSNISTRFVNCVRPRGMEGRGANWSERMTVSPPQSNHRLCRSESRYGCCVREQVRAFGEVETNLGQAVCAQRNRSDVVIESFRELGEAQGRK